jgi:roadblock/LC7 domain-containing protein
LKKTKIKLLVAIGMFTISMASTAAMEDKKDMLDITGGPSVNLPVTQLKYMDTGIYGIDKSLGTLKAASAYGDLQHSAHGTFIKMPAGFVSENHIHTGGYYAVVISGVGVNGVPGSKDISLPVGSYWYQKGSEYHVSKCISQNECIFFISQSVKFDEIFENK